MGIHPTAIVAPGAELEATVEVGPYAVIGPHVRLGAACQILAHSVIDGWTVIEPGCTIGPAAALGGPPQDRKYQGEPTQLVIGSGSVIREYVTVHRSTSAAEPTRIGAGAYLMASCHVGHNCQLGDEVTITSFAGLSGHVVVEPEVIISGFVGVHQFVRIGRLALVSGQSGVTKDVPPFVIVEGRPAVVRGLNTVGLLRRGLGEDRRRVLKQAFRLLFRSKQNVRDALAAVRASCEPTAEVCHLVDFIAASERGICR
ncbi:MAG: acyl-ACP--UDP-N-acetylglucosamine O-acyltransferase [Candidatus Tectomicrobia bacterium]|nr:acyl-ACP--UDP-N-acetylglucosamine O-acyltransferase [Candidatus Tectomicrobia bacterium]